MDLRSRRVPPAESVSSSLRPMPARSLLASNTVRPPEPETQQARQVETSVVPADVALFRIRAARA